ncbi:MAG TPA: DNA gyrase inhibitor YacG [Myxococcota bacterium]
MVEPARTTRCPTCRCTIEHDDAFGMPVPRPAHAPFCSERCKLIDLGQWLLGQHAIPTDEIDDDTEH